MWLSDDISMKQGGREECVSGDGCENNTCLHWLGLHLTSYIEFSHHPKFLMGDCENMYMSRGGTEEFIRDGGGTNISLCCFLYISLLRPLSLARVLYMGDGDIFMKQAETELYYLGC